jgi:Right handed beta helix region
MLRVMLAVSVLVLCATSSSWAFVPTAPDASVLFNPSGGSGAGGAVTLTASPQYGVVYNSGDTSLKCNGANMAQNQMCLTWNLNGNTGCTIPTSPSGGPSPSGFNGNTNNSGTITFSSAQTYTYTLTCGAHTAQVAAQAWPSGYFVATNGNDTWSGTLAAPNAGNTDGPFATLQKAEQVISGVSAKNAYIRSGTYSPTASGGTCAGEQGSAVRLNGPADNGEMWSYYPPDGVDSAIINGGPGNLNCGFDIENNGDTVANITVNGLTFENFGEQGILVIGGSNLSFINNIIHDLPQTSTSSNTTYLAAIQIECFSAQSNWGGFTISHNYIYNLGQNGTRIDNGSNGAETCGATSTPQNVVISYNYIQNVCSTDGDCGAIYFADDNPPSNAPAQVEYNYINGVDVNQNFDPYNVYNAAGIYWDGNDSNFTVTGNIFTGGFQACIGVDGFGYMNVTGNICDMTNESNTHGGGVYIVEDGKGGFDSLTDSLNDQFTNNIVISNSSSTGGGYNSGGPGNVEPMYITNNAYYNYGSAGAINYSCSSGTCGANGTSTTQDNNPTYENPQICGWNYKIAASSPVYNSPVSFPALPSNWGTAGFWGPPGFTAQQSGTSPSQPTTGCS